MFYCFLIVKKRMRKQIGWLFGKDYLPWRKEKVTLKKKRTSREALAFWKSQSCFGWKLKEYLQKLAFNRKLIRRYVLLSLTFSSLLELFSTIFFWNGQRLFRSLLCLFQNHSLLLAKIIFKQPIYFTSNN